MSRSIAVTGIVAASIAIAAGLYAWRIGSLDAILDSSHEAVPVCIAAIKEQLRSPSSFHVIDTEYTPAPPLTYEEFGDYVDTVGCPYSPYQEGCATAKKLGDAYSLNEHFSKLHIKHPTKRQRQQFLESIRRKGFDNISKLPADEQQTAWVKVTYDAVNAYNAPVRSTEVCRFGRKGDKGFLRSDMFWPKESCDQSSQYC